MKHTIEVPRPSRMRKTMRRSANIYLDTSSFKHEKPYKNRSIRFDFAMSKTDTHIYIDPYTTNLFASRVDFWIVF